MEETFVNSDPESLARCPTTMLKKAVDQLEDQQAVVSPEPLQQREPEAEAEEEPHQEAEERKLHLEVAEEWLPEVPTSQSQHPKRRQEVLHEDQHLEDLHPEQEDQHLEDPEQEDPHQADLAQEVQEDLKDHPLELLQEDPDLEDLEDPADLAQEDLVDLAQEDLADLELRLPQRAWYADQEHQEAEHQLLEDLVVEDQLLVHPKQHLPKRLNQNARRCTTMMLFKMTN